jgi:hypothetical protein
MATAAGFTTPNPVRFKSIQKRLYRDIKFGKKQKIRTKYLCRYFRHPTKY